MLNVPSGIDISSISAPKVMPKRQQKDTLSTNTHTQSYPMVGCWCVAISSRSTDVQTSKTSTCKTWLPKGLTHRVPPSTENEYPPQMSSQLTIREVPGPSCGRRFVCCPPDIERRRLQQMKRVRRSVAGLAKETVHQLFQIRRVHFDLIKRRADLF